MGGESCAVFNDTGEADGYTVILAHLGRDSVDQLEYRSWERGIRGLVAEALGERISTRVEQHSFHPGTADIDSKCNFLFRIRHIATLTTRFASLSWVDFAKVTQRDPGKLLIFRGSNSLAMQVLNKQRTGTVRVARHTYL